MKNKLRQQAVKTKPLTTEQVLRWFPWLTKEQVEDFVKGKECVNNEK